MGAQNSTNGIFVNNIRVLESNLQNGDIVQFGGAAGVPVGTVFAGDFCHIRCDVVTLSVLGSGVEEGFLRRIFEE